MPQRKQKQKKEPPPKPAPEKEPLSAWGVYCLPNGEAWNPLPEQRK